MTIELQALAPWAAFLLSAIALWRTFYRDKQSDTKQEFEQRDLRIGAIAGKVELVEDRVAAVEGELRHLPDKDVTHRLELALASMRTEVRELAVTMKPINATMERLQEALVERVKEKV